MNIQNNKIHSIGIFFLLLLAYHLIFCDYFPLPNGRMGHDYALTLANFTDGFLWFKNNGFLTPPWFTPSFCGGQAFFADPQSAFYSVPQFLSFIFDPLQAVYLAFLLFAAFGYWGMYAFSSSCLRLNRLSCIVAGTVFMFNGFYSHRMMIGHYGFQAFMLAPLIAFLLLHRPHIKILSSANGFLAIAAGAMVAYCFHSGLTTLMIPSALSVIALACIVSLRSDNPVWKPFLIRGAIATILAIGLCASKLNANVSLVSNFTRDYYLLPGISDIWGLLEFVFQSLFYSSEHVYQTVTPLWENMQWKAMPHELAFSVTAIPLIIIIIRLGTLALAIAKTKSKNTFTNSKCNKSQSQGRHNIIISVTILSIILLIPIALLYYSPQWNTVLKKIPIINATTSPFRWLIIFLPLIAACTGLACNGARKSSELLAIIILIGIPILNGLENREFYRLQNYNPAPLIDFYHKVRNSQEVPKIQVVGSMMADNSQLASGISPARCYNPLYGYKLEKLPNTLRVGPIDLISQDRTLNFYNPACSVFPKENSCKPFDKYREDQLSDLKRFSSYRPFNFQKSSLQKIAEAITSTSLLFLLMLPILLIRYIRQTSIKSHVNQHF